MQSHCIAKPQSQSLHDKANMSITDTTSLFSSRSSSNTPPAMMQELSQASKPQDHHDVYPHANAHCTGTSDDNFTTTALVSFKNVLASQSESSSRSTCTNSSRATPTICADDADLPVLSTSRSSSTISSITFEDIEVDNTGISTIGTSSNIIKRTGTIHTNTKSVFSTFQVSSSSMLFPCYNNKNNNMTKGGPLTHVSSDVFTSTSSTSHMNGMTNMVMSTGGMTPSFSLSPANEAEVEAHLFDSSIFMDIEDRFPELRDNNHNNMDESNWCNYNKEEDQGRQDHSLKGFFLADPNDIFGGMEDSDSTQGCRGRHRRQGCLEDNSFKLEKPSLHSLQARPKNFFDFEFGTKYNQLYDMGHTMKEDEKEEEVMNHYYDNEKDMEYEEHHADPVTVATDGIDYDPSTESQNQHFSSSSSSYAKASAPSSSQLQSYLNLPTFSSSFNLGTKTYHSNSSSIDNAAGVRSSSLLPFRPTLHDESTVTSTADDMSDDDDDDDGPVLFIDSIPLNNTKSGVTNTTPSYTNYLTTKRRRVSLDIDEVSYYIQGGKGTSTHTSTVGLAVTTPKTNDARSIIQPTIDKTTATAKKRNVDSMTPTTTSYYHHINNYHAPTPIHANKTMEGAKLYHKNISSAFDSWNNMNNNGQLTTTTTTSNSTSSNTTDITCINDTNTMDVNKGSYYHHYNSQRNNNTSFTKVASSTAKVALAPRNEYPIPIHSPYDNYHKNNNHHYHNNNHYHYLSNNNDNFHHQKEKNKNMNINVNNNTNINDSEENYNHHEYNSPEIMNIIKNDSLDEIQLKGPPLLRRRHSVGADVLF